MLKKRKDRGKVLVILLGLISLFGDMVYEGVKSVLGAYLYSIGLGSVLVGIIGGVGEGAGYILRVISGYISDRFRAYYFMLFLGYSSLFFLPLIGFTKAWYMILILLLFERVGKALRTPSRDTLLSYASTSFGKGLSFGIHKSFDQLGSFMGVLIVAFILYYYHNFSLAFKVLFVPSVGVLIVLLVLKNKINDKIRHLKERKYGAEKMFNSDFVRYLLFVFFISLGSLNFHIISYHVKKIHVMNEAYIPILYVISIVFTVLTSLGIGKIYDIFGNIISFLIPFSTVWVSLLFLSKSLIAIYISVIFYGITSGMHSTILRANIASLSSEIKRGAAYGWFYGSYGFSLLLGSTIIGYIYSISRYYVFIYVMSTQIISLGIFLLFKRRFM